MIPGDLYREDKDPVASDFPPGLANELQRDLTVAAASGTKATLPAYPGGTGRWGGARRLVACFYGDPADLADAGVWEVDAKAVSGIDWRNRLILIAEAWFLTAGNGAKAPGGGSEDLIQPNTGAEYFRPANLGTALGDRTLYTKTGSADGVASGTSPAGYHYAFRDGAAALKMALYSSEDGTTLRLQNHYGAGLGGIFLVLDVCDQFPTRVGY